MVGHAGVSISTNKAIILGGVNKQIFDKYFIDLNNTKNNSPMKNKVINDYFNKPIESYFFNRVIL
ncbi:N-acetylneuraminic acid mutarotase, partial [Morganella morganii]